METFNMSRYIIFVQHFLDRLSSGGIALSVSEVNKKENVWCFWPSNVEKIRDKIKLGVSVESHVRKPQDLKNFKNIFHGSNYLLTTSVNNSIINISLNEDCSVQQQLEAVFHACVIDYAKTRSKSDDWGIQQIIDEVNSSNCSLDLIKLTRKFTIDTFPNMAYKTQQAGWNIEYILFTPGEWRSVWC